MWKSIKLFLTGLMIVASLIMTGCDNGLMNLEEVNTDVDSRNFTDTPDAEFNRYIVQLPYFPQSTDNVGVETISSNDMGLFVEKEYKATQEFSELFLMDPAADILWPGCMINPNTISSGAYAQLPAEMAPYRVSLDMYNIENSPTQLLEETDSDGTVRGPSLSVYRNALNNILNQNLTGSIPANINFTIEKVYSTDQLKMAFGGNYKYGKIASVDASFNYNDSEVKSRILVKYIQKYFTANLDIPPFPGEFFTKPYDFQQWLEQLNINYSPAYLSSITYGRMVLFTLESTESDDSVSAALNAAFSYGEHSAGTDLSTEYKNILSNSTINALIIGGSGEAAVQSINGLEGILDYISTGGSYSKESPGKPLSYTLKYLKDNSVATVKMTTEYTAREYIALESDEPEYTVELVKLVCRSDSDPGSYAEFYGNLGYNVQTTGTITPSDNDANNHYKKWLWSYSESQYKYIKESGGTLWTERRHAFKLTNPDVNKDYIELCGNIKEDDHWGDDNLGSRSLRIYLKDIQPDTEYVVNYSGDGTSLDAYYKITVK